MNLLAFALVLGALILGVIIIGMCWRAKGTPAFLAGVAIALVSAGEIIQEVFQKWSHGVHQ